MSFCFRFWVVFGSSVSSLSLFVLVLLFPFLFFYGFGWLASVFCVFFVWLCCWPCCFVRWLAFVFCFGPSLCFFAFCLFRGVVVGVRLCWVAGGCVWLLLCLFGLVGVRGLLFVLSLFRAFCLLVFRSLFVFLLVWFCVNLLGPYFPFVRIGASETI